MAKKTIEIRVNKEDGTLSSKTHGVKGAECLDLLESLLGELTSVETRELTEDYEDEYVAHHTTQSKVDTKQGKGGSE